MLELVRVTNSIWPSGVCHIHSYVIKTLTLQSLSFSVSDHSLWGKPAARPWVALRRSPWAEQLSPWPESQWRTEPRHRPGQWVSQEADLPAPGELSVWDTAPEPLSKATPEFLGTVWDNKCLLSYEKVLNITIHQRKASELSFYTNRNG